MKGDEIMPRRDGSGPGPCGGCSYHRPKLGRRSGYGAGFGRGYGNYNPDLYESYPIDEKMKKNLMENEKRMLEEGLKNIKDMLNELED